MRMRFIGENGSLGFRNGCVYDVTVSTDAICNLLILGLNRHPFTRCPYESPQSLAKNWETAEEKYPA